MLLLMLITLIFYQFDEDKLYPYVVRIHFIFKNDFSSVNLSSTFLLWGITIFDPF